MALLKHKYTGQVIDAEVKIASAGVEVRRRGPELYVTLYKDTRSFWNEWEVME